LGIDFNLFPLFNDQPGVIEIFWQICYKNHSGRNFFYSEGS